MTNKWRNALAFPHCSVREVIQIIDRESLRAAFIVDENDMLQGVVTDGDIRRALLKNVDLDSSVKEVMHVNPLTCSPSQSRKTIKSIIEQNKLLHMPIVDNGKLIDVVILEDFVDYDRLENPVFIMAGGFGTRLRPLTDDCPKPMLKIGGKPILESIISRFIHAGFYRFYISTHYKADMIKSYFGDGSSSGIQIEYVDEDSPLGTAGALGLLPESLPNLPLVMINGDILTQINFRQLLEYHAENNGIATMCVRQYQYQVPYGVIETDGKLITSITEKPSYSFFVNSGIYVLEPSIIKKVKTNEVVDMPELLKAQMDAGLDVTMYPLHEYWLDIGKMQDFERAQVEYHQVFDEEN
ncbi:nucleotidyltransferase family protein [Alteromonas sp. a30]|uniref:nucleotidyltransferase family protein n=1 Tax=Alteromonas sp. a30 TaxID=2730917 RepID=UPI0022813C42|nr:nucleotidyltransferase family protein [Alteromonas sp. a30]MCY7294357.1 CBS domain-containing protein [Alteromonas sp. a30]